MGVSRRVFSRLHAAPSADGRDLGGAPVAIGGDTSWHPAGHRLLIADPDVGRLALHAVSLGAGPDLLLLHGYVQASWCWRDVLEPLAQRYRVHALCLPGFGWSDNPIGAPMRLRHQAVRVRAWLDAMAIARCHVIGCSLGGATALQLALLEPGRVDRLVLANPAGAGVYPMAALAALQHPAFEPLLALPGVPYGLELGLRHAAYAQLPIDDHYMKHFLAPLRTEGAVAAALAVARSYNRDLAELHGGLRRIHQPTLIVRGDRDRVIPAKIVAGVARALPAAHLVRYPRSGHCPMEDEPLRFAADALAWLAAEGMGPLRTPA